MARGGRREGSGRKKGGHNSLTRELALTAQSTAQRLGTSPLAVLIQFATDPEQPVHVRLSAATAAAPFCHPKFGTLPGTLAPAFGADGKLIEGSSEPIAPSTVTINVIPVPSGLHEDNNGNLVPCLNSPPDLKIVSVRPEPDEDDEIS
jgi:hypothetical protein